MRDSEVLAYFDGRPTADVPLLAFQVADGDKVAAIAYEFGYRQVSAGPASRTTYRMVFARDDSPDVRKHAEIAMNRVRLGGPVLPSAPRSPYGQEPADSLKLAAARRNVAAYENSSAKGLACVIGLGGLCTAATAPAFQDRPYALVALLAVGAILIAVALMTPTLMKRWHKRNKAIIDDFSRARAAAAGVTTVAPRDVTGRGRTEQAGQ